MYFAFEPKKKNFFSWANCKNRDSLSFCVLLAFWQFGLGHVTLPLTPPPKKKMYWAFTCIRHSSGHFTYIILTALRGGYPHLQIREMMHREGKWLAQSHPASVTTGNWAQFDSWVHAFSHMSIQPRFQLFDLKIFSKYWILTCLWIREQHFRIMCHSWVY